MNRLVILLFIVFTSYTVDGRSTIFKIQQEASPEEQLQQDAISQVHTRERRSTEKKAYVFFDNRSERTIKLFWRDVTNPSRGWSEFKQLRPGAVSRINTFETNEWKTEEAGTKKSLTINDQMIFTPKANTEKTRTVCIIKRQDQSKGDIVIEKYVETLIVVDKSIRDMFDNKEEVERYVKLFFSIGTQVYQHETLTQNGLKIYLVPSKIEILENEIKFDISNNKNNLYVACRRMNEIAKSERYDHKLFFTRNEFGAAGFAREDGMCSQSSSCSIVLDTGFTSVFTVAHEIAHSLGVPHDDFKQYSRYIMSPLTDSTFNNHRWSLESQSLLLKNTRNSFSCLNNIPSVIKDQKLDHENPGIYFSFEKQCDLEFGEDYTARKPNKWQPSDPCKNLRCNMPGKWSFLHKSSGSSALNGTTCGENKWCKAGKCTEKPTDHGTQAKTLLSRHR